MLWEGGLGVSTLLCEALLLLLFWFSTATEDVGIGRIAAGAGWVAAAVGLDGGVVVLSSGVVLGREEGRVEIAAVLAEAAVAAIVMAIPLG